MQDFYIDDILGGGDLSAYFGQSYANDFEVIQDYHTDAKEFTNPFSRTSRYLNGYFEGLKTEGLTVSGKGQRTRDNCGQIRGVKRGRGISADPHPIFNNCAKLDCPICVRSAASIKANNILDHIQSVIFTFMFAKVHFSPVNFFPNGQKRKK
jgi:hypothetical protein